MATSYPEELAKWVKRQRSTHPTSSVAEFLAIRDDVEAALDAGYPMTTIWRQLKERRCLNVCYDTFRGYVKRHITDRKNRTSLAHPLMTPAPIVKANQSGIAHTQVNRDSATSAGSNPGFTFNPNPKKEDLI